ncbi:MAG: hypothetical protein HRU15_02175 [Planctomycetes bacterium]|nr:hypothetical protein [Planctomycetota bacterium]
MSGFMRTLIIGFAALFMIAAGAVVTVGLTAGGDVKRVMRSFILSDDERAAIESSQKHTVEAPLIQRVGHESEDELLAALAERVGSNKISQVHADLKAKLNSLRERDAYLEQRYTEMRIAEGDLDRKARQLKRERIELLVLVKEMNEDQAEFARKQSAIVLQIQVLSEVERKRMLDQAKIFEQMKDAAWKSLRNFSASEIARYLALMDSKKAAKILSLANADDELPSIGYEIIKQWRMIDLEGVSGDQIKRLAGLYVYMPAPEVADILLKRNNVDEAATIMMEMQNISGAKKVAALKQVLLEKDQEFLLQIDRLLAQSDGVK